MCLSVNVVIVGIFYVCIFEFMYKILDINSKKGSFVSKIVSEKIIENTTYNYISEEKYSYLYIQSESKVGMQ